MTDRRRLYYSRWSKLGPSIQEADEWREDGENIFDDTRLAAVEHHLANVGCVAVEHWHYRGSRAPTRLVFDGFEAFCEYLQNETKPGDAVDAYAFPHDQEPIAKGKCPDPKGRVPKGGAY